MVRGAASLVFVSWIFTQLTNPRRAESEVVDGRRVNGNTANGGTRQRQRSARAAFAFRFNAKVGTHERQPWYVRARDALF